MQARKVLFTAQSKVEVVDVAVGDPAPGQVLLQTIHSAISPGTELAFLHHYPNTSGKYPWTPGYTACSRVLKVGADVAGLAEGDTVVSFAGHASHALVAAERCHPIAGVPSEQAAAYRLASIVIQGIRKARLQLGESVAILGLGPIGHIAGQLARANGATCVLGIDPVEWRRTLATAHGFDYTAASFDALPATKGSAHDTADGFDVAVEATGAPPPILQAMLLTRRLGRLILLGSTRGNCEDVNFYRDVHKKGLTLIGAHDSIRGPEGDIGEVWSNLSDEKAVVALLESGRLNLGGVVSETMPAEQAPKAYERLTERNEEIMTLALDWQ